MSMTIGVLLKPLDVLFFRDSFQIYEGIRAGSLPTPQTFAGAMMTLIHSKLGKTVKNGKEYIDWEQLNKGNKSNDITLINSDLAQNLHELYGISNFRGPWLARKNGSDVPTVYFKAPSTLATSDSGITSFLPLNDDYGFNLSEDNTKRLWSFASDAKPLDKLICDKGLKKYLSFNTVCEDDLIDESDLISWATRTGNAIHPKSFSTEKGMLYTLSVLELFKDTYFYGEIVFNNDIKFKEIKDIFSPLAVINWGGEGKKAQVELTKHIDLFDFSPERTASNGGELLYLASPGIFENGAYPDFERDSIIAASVTGSIPISGWNFYKKKRGEQIKQTSGPKPTRFAVPEGSVYFFDQEVKVEKLSNFDDDTLRGYGAFLKGVWNYV